MQDANGKVEVQITHPHSTDPTAPRVVNVRITDAASRLGIVEFNLTAAQFDASD